MLVIAALLGAAVGIFILYPTNEFVYFYEYRPLSESTPGGFALSQLQSALRGGTPKKTVFYAIVGIVLSVSAAGFYAAMHRRSEQIEQLSAALGDDLRALIARGESANLEFKSSFRWDLRENKLNRALEAVVLKTLAGYMNGNGGTLLIGVADDGSVVRSGARLHHAQETRSRRLRASADDCRRHQAGRRRVSCRADGIPFAGEQRRLPRDGRSGTSAGLCEGRRQSKALRADRREHARTERPGGDQLHLRALAEIDRRQISLLALLAGAKRSTRHVG